MGQFNTNIDHLISALYTNKNISFEQDLNNTDLQQHIMNQHINDIRQIVIKMGVVIQTMLKRSAESLNNRCVKTAHSSIELKKEIIKLEEDLTEKSIKLIASGRLNLNDIRQIIMCIKITGKLKESINLAEIVANRAIAHLNENPLVDITKMADEEFDSVYRSVTSFIKGSDLLNEKQADHNIDSIKDLLYLEQILHNNPQK